MEKRVDKRHNCEAGIIFNCFNKGENYNAKMLNYSKDGMYFESNSFLKEGTNILFKMRSCQSGTSKWGVGEGLRTVSLAEVRWWKEMVGHDSPHFGIGVKYY